MTIAEEFEKRDQSIQALLQRGLQKRYPGEGLHLPSVGEVSGDLFVKENIDEPNDDGLYVYLSSSVPQLNGWVRLQSASEQLPLTVVYDPRNDGEGAGGSTNPLISYKENGTSYFEMPTDAVKIIPFNGAISSFGKKDDLAIAIRFRASFSDSMTSDDQAVLVVRWATAIADDIASSLIFNERMFLLRDDGGFTAGVTSVFFKAIILGRDFEDDSSLFLQFGRLGDDPRDNYSGSVELQMPQFKFMVMRPNDIVNNCFVGSARVSEGDPQTVYDTDYAGLLGLPSRRL
jgi:hypothetical protein